MFTQARRASRLTTGGLVVDDRSGPLVVNGVGIAVWFALGDRDLGAGDLVDEVADLLDDGPVDAETIWDAVNQLESLGLLCRTSND